MKPAPTNPIDAGVATPSGTTCFDPTEVKALAQYKMECQRKDLDLKSMEKALQASENRKKEHSWYDSDWLKIPAALLVGYGLARTVNP